MALEDGAGPEVLGMCIVYAVPLGWLGTPQAPSLVVLAGLLKHHIFS